MSPFCSGTLVTPTVVVTAAHCLTSTRGKKWTPTSPGAVAIYVGDQPSVDILANLYMVSEVKVHPRYNISSLQNDIALIRLSSSVSDGSPHARVDAVDVSTIPVAGGDQNFVVRR